MGIIRLTLTVFGAITALALAIVAVDYLQTGTFGTRSHSVAAVQVKKPAASVSLPNQGERHGG